MERLLSGDDQKVSIEEGYARCASLARTHYENFTVGSLLVPRDKRKHLYALYAFCRFVDDLGDEYSGDRNKALDAYERDLLRCYDGSPKHAYLVALQETIRTFDIPMKPFRKLIHANRMDQVNTCYKTYENLKHYCNHSANPVGHMVLYVFGHRDHERQILSDLNCTALQLANFWQDVTRDYDKGRIYIPMEDISRFGYSEDLIGKGLHTLEFRNLMAFEVERTRDLFEQGTKLFETLQGRVKTCIELFSSGGLKILDAIEEQDYNVLDRRPVVSKKTKLKLVIRATLKLGLGFKK